MKSIVIDGITFTDRKPDREGYWLHVFSGIRFVTAGTVRRIKGDLFFDRFTNRIADVDGYWCELIPVQSKAHQ